VDPLLSGTGVSERLAAAPGSAAGRARPLRVVWERGLDLAVEVFRLQTGDGGLEPALCQKLRCAAIEVPTALARAIGRSSRGLRLNLIAALGALAEIESHLALAGRLGSVPEEMLAGLRTRLRILRRLIVGLGCGQPESGGS
jgi:four helix bundle protein